MSCSKPYYSGPVSDHYDQKVFRSVDPFEDKSFWTVLKWRLTADRAAWPKWVDIKPSKPPAHVAGKELRVTFVNHSTVLVQTGNLNILTDPIWSQRCSPVSWLGPKRVHAPGIAWDDLPKIDVVAISHSHYDHLDLPTVKKLVARDNPLIIVPLGVDSIIHSDTKEARVTALDWGGQVKLDDLIVHVVPAHHWSARSYTDRNKALWGGFVFETPGGKIYYTGDTGFGQGTIFRNLYKKFGEMRLAIMPLGAYEPRWFMKDSHINPSEAVDIYKLVHAQNALGVHIGTFQLSDEAREAPAQDLAKILETQKIATNKFRTLEPGQAWVLP